MDEKAATLDIWVSQRVLPFVSLRATTAGTSPPWSSTNAVMKCIKLPWRNWNDKFMQFKSPPVKSCDRPGEAWLPVKYSENKKSLWTFFNTMGSKKPVKYENKITDIFQYQKRSASTSSWSKVCICCLTMAYVWSVHLPKGDFARTPGARNSGPATAGPPRVASKKLPGTEGKSIYFQQNNSWEFLEYTLQRIFDTKHSTH